MLSSIECGYCGFAVELAPDTTVDRVACPYCHRAVQLPKTDLETGSTFGAYRIDKLLGVGGMGDVYLAVQHPINRKVALKILPSNLTADRDSLDRFFNEMRMTAKFEHPNIVAAIEAGKVGDLHYLAMSYVDGQDLDVILVKDGVMAESQALGIVRKVASALDYAWNKGQVLHRDIKPGNIMLDNSGEVRLMDLGISKSLKDPRSGGQTTAGYVVGTPYYMSPEQARGSNDLDFRSDIYSLGATLYHMVTGSEPFDNEDPLVVMTQHINEPVPSPKEKNSALTNGCCALLKRMLAKPQNERHETWQTLVDDIDRVLDGKMPSEAAVATPNKMSNKKKSLPAGAAGRAAGLKLKVGASQAKRLRGAATAPRLMQATQPKNLSSRLSIIRWLFIGVGLVLLATFIIIAISRDSNIDQPIAGPVTDGQTKAPLLGTPTTTLSYTTLLRDIERARAFAQEQPKAYREILQRWQALSSEAANTPHAKTVEQEIGQASSRLEQTRQSMLTSLELVSNELSAAGDYDSAIAAVRDYNGEFADETRTERNKLEQSLIESQALQASPPEPEPEPELELEPETFPNIQFIKWRDQAIAAVLDLDIRQIKQELQAMNIAATVPGDVDALELYEEIQKTTTLPTLVLNGFRRVEGKKTRIRTTDGELSLDVVKVEGDTIKCTEELEFGHMPKNIKLTDLSSTEMRKRLGRREEPHLHIMRGLLFLQENKEKLAFNYFNRAATPLASLLTERVLASHRAGLEQEAVEALKSVLARVNLSPADLGSPEKIQLAPNNPGRLITALDAFLNRYGGTETAVNVRPALESIRDRLQTQRPVPGPGQNQPTAGPRVKDLLVSAKRVNQGQWKLRTSALLKKLRQKNQNVKNPKLWASVQFQPLRNGEIGSVRMPIDGMTNLSALSALDGLVRVEFYAWNSERVAVNPLTPMRNKKLLEVTVSNCKLRHLNHLEGMPLQRLNVSNNRIIDADSIADHKLEYLNISDNPLRSDFSFAKMPLRSLDISRTEIAELKNLGGIQTLTHLAIDGTPVRTLQNLAGLKLLSLSASGTKVASIESLTNMPLQHLNLADTQVHKFDVVAKFKLVGLDFSNTPFRNIDMLKSMPLESVTLNGCPITRLRPIARKKIRYLAISNTDVTSILPVKTMPIEKLYISNTDVSDLSPLGGKKISVLHAEGCPITTLSSLANCPITELNIKNTAIKDLSALMDMKLVSLNISGTRVTELEPLERTQLRNLTFSNYRPRRDDEILRGIHTLVMLNSRTYRRRN